MKDIFSDFALRKQTTFAQKQNKMAVEARVGFRLSRPFSLNIFGQETFKSNKICSEFAL